MSAASELLSKIAPEGSVRKLRQVLSNTEKVWGSDMGEEGLILLGDKELLETVCSQLAIRVKDDKTEDVPWIEVVEALGSAGRRASGIGMSVGEQVNMIEPLVRAILEKASEVDRLNIMRYSTKMMVGQTVKDYFPNQRVGSELRERGVALD